jgi:hypothetical protein
LTVNETSSTWRSTSSASFFATSAFAFGWKVISSATGASARRKGARRSVCNVFMVFLTVAGRAG